MRERGEVTVAALAVVGLFSLIVMGITTYNERRHTDAQLCRHEARTGGTSSSLRQTLCLDQHGVFVPLRSP